MVSTTLDRVEWKNSTLLKGDLTQAITALKGQPGKNIGVGGSITLVQSLLELGLLDELRLTVHPVIAGQGRRLFKEDGSLKRLKLVEHNTTKSGVAILAYQPDRSA